jgi:hypothetical protein
VKVNGKLMIETLIDGVSQSSNEFRTRERAVGGRFCPASGHHGIPAGGRTVAESAIRETFRDRKSKSPDFISQRNSLNSSVPSDHPLFLLAMYNEKAILRIKSAKIRCFLSLTQHNGQGLDHSFSTKEDMLQHIL